MNDEPIFIKSDELARRMNITAQTVNVWVRKGIIPPFCYQQTGIKSPRLFLTRAVEFVRRRGRWPNDENELAAAPM